MSSIRTLRGMEIVHSNEQYSLFSFMIEIEQKVVGVCLPVITSLSLLFLIGVHKKGRGLGWTLPGTGQNLNLHVRKYTSFSIDKYIDSRSMRTSVDAVTKPRMNSAGIR